MKKTALATGLAISLLLGACGNTGTDDIMTPDPAILANTTWNLDRIVLDGVAVPIAAGTTPTMSFKEGSINGSTGCNSFGGQVNLTGTTFAVGEIAQTLIGCPDAINAQEQAMMTILRRADRWTLDGTVLSIGAVNGSGTLEFSAPIDQPALPLEGVTWRLTTLVTGEDARSVVAGAEATLVVSGDTVDGSTGCNTFSAGIETDDASVTVFEMYWTEIGCSPEIMAQEAFVLTTLQEATTYEIEGSRLLITSPSGALIYDAD